MRYWVKQGAPVSKLNLGLPFYGRSFTLDDPSKNGLMAPVTVGGNAGEYTGEAGFLAYYEVNNHLFYFFFVPDYLCYACCYCCSK